MTFSRYSLALQTEALAMSAGWNLLGRDLDPGADGAVKPNWEGDDSMTSVHILLTKLQYSFQNESLECTAVSTANFRNLTSTVSV